jgi:glycosyltransferase involved in cell wall biosynthesis
MRIGGFMKGLQVTELICVINNYNYAKYLEESIVSALNQTLPFSKIIVVDDGSTDTSRDIIERLSAKHATLIPVLKNNEGQLSCFNAATQYIPEDSHVFLMDSDDLFPSNYVEEFNKKVKVPTDFCFVKSIDFHESGEEIKSAYLNDLVNIVFPKTEALVRIREAWIGNVTSSISLSGRIYKRLLPCPFQEDWRARADDLFIFAVSHIGASKTYIPSIGIAYRKHGKNDHLVKAGYYESPEEAVARGVRFNKLLDFYCKKLDIARDSDPSELFSELDASGIEGKKYFRNLGFKLLAF